MAHYDLLWCGETVASCAVIDTAIDEAKRITRPSSSGLSVGLVLVFLVDNAKRTPRAFAEQGKIRWAVVCPLCKGSPLSVHSCFGCDALGAVPEKA